MPKVVREIGLQEKCQGVWEINTSGPQGSPLGASFQAHTHTLLAALTGEELFAEDLPHTTC